MPAQALRPVPLSQAGKRLAGTRESTTDQHPNKHAHRDDIAGKATPDLSSAADDPDWLAVLQQEDSTMFVDDDGPDLPPAPPPSNPANMEQDQG
ncbi:Uncharacterized protein PBTT_01569 [Plasmodiophora brassicae]